MLKRLITLLGELDDGWIARRQHELAKLVTQKSQSQQQFSRSVSGTDVYYNLQLHLFLDSLSELVNQITGKVYSMARKTKISDLLGGLRITDEEAPTSDTAAPKAASMHQKLEKLLKDLRDMLERAAQKFLCDGHHANIIAELKQHVETIKELELVDAGPETFEEGEVSNLPLVNVIQVGGKHYRIEKKIGNGAYRVVFEAKCLSTAMPVAMKLVCIPQFQDTKESL